MPVIAVVNRKGGSGKSTLATHLAAYFANQGFLAMLGDVDRQQSTQTWLKLRAQQNLPRSAPILGWAVDPRNVLRAPSGITHVILDTPGGMRGFDMARVVGYADAILVPVCNSVFDRDSAADCLAELRALPKVASGRCQVGALGMRLDARTRASDTLREWAALQPVPYLGMLRESQTYVKTVEQGLSLFDLPPSKSATDLAQWAPILAWLEDVLAGAADRAPGAPHSAAARASQPSAAGLRRPVDTWQPHIGAARFTSETADPVQPAVPDVQPAGASRVPRALAAARVKAQPATSDGLAHGAHPPERAGLAAPPALPGSHQRPAVPHTTLPGVPVESGSAGRRSSSDAGDAFVPGLGLRLPRSDSTRASVTRSATAPNGPGTTAAPLLLGKVTAQAGLRSQLRRWLEILCTGRVPGRKVPGSLG